MGHEMRQTRIPCRLGPEMGRKWEALAQNNSRVLFAIALAMPRHAPKHHVEAKKIIQAIHNTVYHYTSRYKSSLKMPLTKDNQVNHGTDGLLPAVSPYNGFHGTLKLAGASF